MKKLFSALIIVSVFLTNALFSAVVQIDMPTITESEFDNALANSEFIVQFQPGGPGTTHPDNEFEFGELGGTLGIDFYEGNTSITEEADNPFVIDISASNFLTVSFNGVSNGEAYGIDTPFNRVWIGLATTGAVSTIDEFNLTDMEFGDANLPGLTVVGQNKFIGYSFYFDDSPTNIGESLFTGNFNPDTFIGFSSDEQWTFTVAYTFDETIVPEPGSYSLLFGLVTAAFAVVRRRR
jgi:hypothetical protein